MTAATPTAPQLTQHPIGQLLPPMSDEEYEYVRDDIKRHGLKEPILLHQGQILDGWHRYRICLELGIEPRFKPIGKGADAIVEVLSRTLARRHLTPAQRYGVLLRIADRHPEVRAAIDGARDQARERQE